MARIGQLIFLSILVYCFSSITLAYEEMPKVEYYKQDNITNQIPYFDNRFRIDGLLDEITLLFYRQSGTPPIILVQPDGTKLKIGSVDSEKIQWFDDRTFDLITIKKPMPGPWQAIGAILPNSKIMVVSDVTIEVTPMPEVVLAGETLKVEGRLFNGEKAIDDPLFRDVLHLDVDFYSTNNSAYDNFGAEPIRLGSFRDDGRDLDEYKGDGVFTGEFKLDFAPGEWVPIYYVKMPMATRELKQKPIVLQEAPITISVETSLDESDTHKVKFSIDPSFVDVDSILLQGKVSFPDKQVEPFSIMEGSGDSRLYEVSYTESGVHRVQVSAFGKTTEGREFRLVLPEFSFNVQHIENGLVPTFDSNFTEEEQEAARLAEVALAAEEERLIEEAIIAQKLLEEEKKLETIILVVVANLVIIILAGLIFWLMKRKKKK